MAVQETQKRPSLDQNSAREVIKRTRESMAPDVICGCNNCAQHAKGVSAFWKVPVPGIEQARDILNLRQTVPQETTQIVTGPEIPEAQQKVLLHDLAKILVANYTEDKIPFTNNEAVGVLYAKWNEMTGQTKRSTGDTASDHSGPENKLTTIFDVGFEDCNSPKEKQEKEAVKALDLSNLSLQQQERLQFMRWAAENNQSWDEGNKRVKEDKKEKEK